MKNFDNDNSTNVELCEKAFCWETVLGQEFYQLTVLDFGVQLGIVFLWVVPKKLILGSGCCGGTFKITVSNHMHVVNKFYATPIESSSPFCESLHVKT